MVQKTVFCMYKLTYIFEFLFEQKSYKNVIFYASFKENGLHDSSKCKICNNTEKKNNKIYFQQQR